LLSQHLSRVEIDIGCTQLLDASESCFMTPSGLVSFSFGILTQMFSCRCDIHEQNSTVALVIAFVKKGITRKYVITFTAKKKKTVTNSLMNIQRSP
jgi:hypothetical protein